MGLASKLFWALLTFALAVAGCSTRQRIAFETGAAKVLVSDADEEKLGAQVKAELEQKQHIRYLNDEVVTAYVQGVANRILTFAKRDRPNQKWQVFVVDDAKVVNAFATPGAYIYVYSGLLIAAENEAEIAGVLAHESGHVVARHAARQIVQVYGLEAALALALGKNPSLLAKYAAVIAANGALLAHSRSDENEADEYGARYSSAAGYDPHGLVTFFQKLQAQSANQSRPPTWLSTHPATPDRIDHVNRFIAENRLPGSDLGADRLQPIKQRLHR